MIPKIIHQSWIGPNEPDSFLKACRDSVSVCHPEWRNLYWRNQSIWEQAFCAELPLDCSLSFKGDHLRCDLLRYLVLYRFGGFYLDHDVWSIRPLDQLCEEDLVFGEHGHGGCLSPQPGQGRTASGIIGVRARHPVILEAIRKTIELGPNMRGFQETVKAHGLAPLSYRFFYPHYWREPDHVYRVFPETYTIHCWVRAAKDLPYIRPCIYNIGHLKELTKKANEN